MTDFESSFTASFASDATDLLDVGSFDPSSPLFGLDGLGGAELSMPTNASTHTVSPHELALHGSPSLYGSAPPSGALTNLTSPDILYNTSPEFGLDNIDGQVWPSLFGDSSASFSSVPAMQRNYSAGSNSSDSPNNSPHVKGVGARSDRPSSIHRNSTSGSLTGSGIQKPRRRQGQLKDIVVDPTDKVAAKRARNTLAARESRNRKAVHVETLEAHISELETENERLRSLLQRNGIPEE